jgi:MurNAc alpha-1-phosphate uridylyltransferase
MSRDGAAAGDHASQAPATHAMLLSAGRGERLRPLTDHTPKPLVEVGGETLIERHLRRLAEAGIGEVVVNLHHLGERIVERVGDGARLGVRVHYAWERELLETGGGIRAVLDRLGPRPFLVVSADLWTDYPLAQLRAPLPDGMLARLVLVRSHLGNDFGFTRTPAPGVVAPLAAEPAEKFTYASLGSYSPALFDGVAEGAFPLRDLLFPALRAGRLCGEVFDGDWFNIGSLRELEDVRAHVCVKGRPT